MKIKNFVLVIIALLVSTLAIGLPFAFNNEVLIGNKTVLIFYIIAKIGFFIIFIGSIGLIITKKVSLSSAVVFLVVNSISMLVAPLMRIILLASSFVFGWCLIILATTMFGLIIFDAFTIYGGKKEIEGKKKFEGNTIPVKEDLPDKF